MDRHLTDMMDSKGVPKGFSKGLTKGLTNGIEGMDGRP